MRAEGRGQRDESRGRDSGLGIRSERARHPVLRPPLKWAGGKRWLVPQLLSSWTVHAQRRFVEPFCGGLAVALGLRPHSARLSDANPHLINFYQWVQRGFTVSIPLRNDEALYYRYREDFNELLRRGKEQSPEAAALFYYLNRTGYNGLCRFNSRGFFNVPYGRYDDIRYRHEFAEFRSALSSWSFSYRDFEATDLGKGDFIYADPPYDVPFTQYSRGGFTWEDQVRLAEWLSSHDGPVVLSNQATARIVKLYEQLGFQLAFFKAPRMISCNGDRAKAREVLATRNVERLFHEGLAAR